MRAMSTATTQPVTASFEYLQKLPLYQKEKPFRVYYEIPKSAADQRRTNLEFEEKTFNVEDIRPASSNFSLDRHGFAVKEFHTSLSMDDFNDKAIVEARFLPEVEKLMRSEISNINALHFFDWRVSSLQEFDEK
jgi:hypothetical protein